MSVKGRYAELVKNKKTRILKKYGIPQQYRPGYSEMSGCRWSMLLRSADTWRIEAYQTLNSQWPQWRA